jgi:EmrB/QacA subfamily drug resistance transporter
VTQKPEGRPELARPRQGGIDGDLTQTLDPQRWLALTVLLVAGFMDLLDVTIVNVAIPSIMTDLQAEYSQIEWIVAGYVLGFAALLITGGRLGDTFGRKRTLIIGVTGFTIASALCGLATSPTVLIGGRFFQGAMAGLMVPQILAIIHVTFPRHERGKVLGLWGAVLGTASVAGLVVGGVLVQWDLFGLQWRPIFLINIPIGIATIIAAYVLVRESRSPAAPRLDLIGVAIAVTGVLMLVYPLTEGRSLGWPVWTFLLMAGSGVLLALFIAYERRRTRTVGSPLVVLSLFRARAFAAGMVVWLVFWVALGGFFLVWTLYMQVGLGWTPLHAGLTAVTFAIGAAAGSGLSVEVFTPRFGRRVLMAGALMGAAGFGGYIWVGSAYGPEINSWHMVAPLLVAGFGFGLVLAPMIDAILTDVPVEDAGSASGVLNTTQQIGMALGVALVGVLFFTQLDNDSGRGVDAATPGLQEQLTAIGIPNSDQDGIIAGFRACVQARSAATNPTETPESCQTGPNEAGQQSDQLPEVLTSAGEDARAHNFSRTFGITLWYAVGIMIIVFIGLFLLPRQVRARDPDAELAMVGEQPGTTVPV